MNIYRVNYSYVSPAGQLRGGAIVVEAMDPEAARAKAADRVPSNHAWPKLTAVSLYQERVTPTKVK